MGFVKCDEDKEGDGSVGRTQGANYKHYQYTQRRQDTEQEVGNGPQENGRFRGQVVGLKMSKQ